MRDDQALEDIPMFQTGKYSRILVADDEEFCLKALSAVLKKANIDQNFVDLCVDGKDAIELV